LSRRFRAAVVMVLLLLAAPVAWPDGGVVRLRETRGALVVTVFTAPDPLRAGPADVSVLVQDLSGAPVLDAEVILRFDPPDRASSPFAVRALGSQATNKLLQAAQVDLREVGKWRLGVAVGRAGQAAELSCVLPVAPATPRLTALWDVLALPPAMVVLFALNHALRRRRLHRAWGGAAAPLPPAAETRRASRIAG
jgi:hypothetical protein